MKLLALIIAYVISHFIEKPERFRQFGWFKQWIKWVQKLVKIESNEVMLLIIIGIPVMIVNFILSNIVTASAGYLIISIVVLSYCIGPESLDEDLESGEILKRIGLRKNAKIANIIKKITQVSLKRWFGVFFWYLVLGLIGAIIYRLSERFNTYIDDNNVMKLSIIRLNKILNYPVAWMMVVSLAIASDFEKIYKKCKPSMNLDNVSAMDTSFLYEAADFAVENCEIENDSKNNIENVTISVLKRMLLVWLVFVAILVIFAI